MDVRGVPLRAVLLEGKDPPQALTAEQKIVDGVIAACNAKPG